MPEEVSRPLPSGLGLSGPDDLGCLCEDKVSHNDRWTLDFLWTLGGTSEVRTARSEPERMDV